MEWEGEGMTYKPCPSLPLHPPQPSEMQMSPWGWGILGNVGGVCGVKALPHPPQPI